MANLREYSGPAAFTTRQNNPPSLVARRSSLAQAAASRGSRRRKLALRETRRKAFYFRGLRARARRNARCRYCQLPGRMHYAARLFEVRPFRFFRFPLYSLSLSLPPFYALVAEAKCRSRSSRGPREADTWRYTKGNASRRSGLIIRSRGTGRHSGANNASAAHLRLRSRRKDGNRITLIAAEMIKGRKSPLFCHAPRFLPLRLPPQFRFLSVAAFYAASAGDCNPLDRPILNRKLCKGSSTK